MNVNVVKSRFCEHIKTVTYHERAWLIIGYDKTGAYFAYGISVLHDAFSCPACSSDCYLNYNKYQNLEKLPSGMQD